MVTSTEPQSGSSTDTKLTHALTPKIQMAKHSPGMSSKMRLQNGLKRIRIQKSDLRTQGWNPNYPIKITQQQDSDNDDDYKIPYIMSFRKISDAVTKKRASREKF